MPISLGLIACSRWFGLSIGGALAERTLEETHDTGLVCRRPCVQPTSMTRFDVEQFRAGMDVEYEHGSHDPQTDVTGDDPVVTGKIALAHMKEFPDYYDRLQRMEQEADRASAADRKGTVDSG